MSAELVEACKEGNVEEVTALLNTDIDPNVDPRTEWTPLHLACERGFVGIVTRLLAHPAIQPDAPGPLDNTPFLHACEFDQDAALVLLKDHRVNVLAVSATGYTGLMRAARKRRMTRFKQLLHHRRCSCSRSGWCLSPYGKEDMVRLLLEDGRIQPNAVNAYGSTALHIAVANGDTISMQALLEDPRVRINILNNRQETPFDVWIREEDPPDITDTRARYHGLYKLFLNWAQRRSVDVCVGLAGLDLPVLQVLLIVEMDAMQNAYSVHLPPLHIMWEWARIVKHFDVISAQPKSKKKEIKGY